MNKESYLNKISVWDESAARHILSRSIYGYTQDQLNIALSVTLDDFVDNYLLADFTSPQPPGDWVNENPIPDNMNVDRDRFRELIRWWIDLMFYQGISFREKMVLFFHNHFVSEAVVVKYPQYLYLQNKLFRQYCFGNVKELAKMITIDPAMLIYLDGTKNSKFIPNENYSRELLELFTIGIGNYTETDIKEGARALTGWRVEGLNSTFYPFLFDSGNKTYLGETGNFGYTDIIDIIFSKQQTSEFLCRKLYKEFVYYEPNEDYVIQLAEVMRNNDYELKPVLSTLLKSEYFHSEEIRSSKIKSPIELLVSSMRQFLINTPDLEYLFITSSALQQTLFNPPDVRGWEGQRKWISSNTYPLRNQFTDSIITGKKYYGGNILEKVDVVDFARSFTSSEDAIKFVDDVSKYLIQFPLSESRKELLLLTLLDGAAVYDWSTYDPQAESRLNGFFKVLMRLPEFQLS